MNDKVQEIRKALEAATPGPWNKEGSEVWRRGTGYNLKDDSHIWICDCFNDDNTYLIANAPEWLYYLLSELEAAKEVIADRTSDVEHLHQQPEEVTERSMNRKYEVERLKEERHLLQKAIESYIRIERDMETDYAALQQQLDAAKQENEMLTASVYEHWCNSKAMLQRLGQVEELLPELIYTPGTMGNVTRIGKRILSLIRAEETPRPKGIESTAIHSE